MTHPRGLAIYVHWPFCVSKCPYCDFNSHVGGNQDQALWQAAYRRELEHYARLLPGRRVTSVFFGGGTPSLMAAATVGAVLESIAKLWVIDPAAEITLEANPSSAEAAKFAGFRAAGVNRLSLGVQSLDNAALAFLGRAHDAAAARAAIALAARHFPRFSFDLIYARQGQSLDAWDRELRDALTLAGDHLSLYQLTIEPHTIFHTRARKGEALTAALEPATQMYELTQGIMSEAGLPAYEISNHARPGAESRHNLTYWRYEDYLGIGPGAHGRYRHDGRRVARDNHKAPQVWLDQVEASGCGVKDTLILAADDAMREAAMMGLRLTVGIDRAAWDAKFATVLADFFDAQKIARLVEEDYLITDAHTVRATPSGLQRLNAILAYLL